MRPFYKKSRDFGNKPLAQQQNVFKLSYQAAAALQKAVSMKAMDAFNR